MTGCGAIPQSVIMLTQYLASLKNLYHLIKNGLQDHSCGLNSFFRFFFHEEWRVVGKKNNPAKCCNELRGGNAI